MALKKLVKEKILNEVIRAISEEHDKEANTKWRILIVDEETLRIISACTKNHELEKIANIELIERNRGNLPHMEAIYLITPTERNINKLINDFEKKKINGLVVNYEIKSRMYQAAHVFFTEKCSDDLIEKIAKSKCSSFILTMKEIYMSFIPIENQVLLFLKLVQNKR